MARLNHQNTTAGAIVYATWDPANAGTFITVTNSDLTETSSGIGEVRATIPVLAGEKRYWEITTGGANTNNMVIGIDNGSGNLNNYTGQDVNTWGLYGQGGGGYHNGGFLYSGSNTLGSYAVGDVIGIALDLVGLTCQFYVNGSVFSSAFPIPASSYFPACGSGGGVMVTIANFGASPFAYTVPAGFTGGVY